MEMAGVQARRPLAGRLLIGSGRPYWESYGGDILLEEQMIRMSGFCKEITCILKAYFRDCLRLQ